MRSITLKLAANGADDFAQIGDYVRVQRAAVPVRIQTGDGETDATLEQGDALNLKPFERLRVSHTSGTEQTITLLIGDGTSADSSKVGGSIAIVGGSIDIVGGSIDIASTPAPAVAFTQTEPAVGVASGLLVAANASRRFLMVQNNSAGGQNVFLNLAGAAATTGGVKLAPGASMVLDVATPSGAVYAIAGAAGAVVVVVEG